MKFTHTCIITCKLETLRDFYRQVLQEEPKVYQEDYLEFPLTGAILSPYRQESLDLTVPGAMQAGHNQSVRLGVSCPRRGPGIHPAQRSSTSH